MHCCSPGAKKCSISDKCWTLMTSPGYNQYSLSHEVFYLEIGEAVNTVLLFLNLSIRSNTLSILKYISNNCKRGYVYRRVALVSGELTALTVWLLCSVPICWLRLRISLAWDTLTTCKTSSWRTVSGCLVPRGHFYWLFQTGVKRLY